jgi:hypothetical protein
MSKRDRKQLNNNSGVGRYVVRFAIPYYLHTRLKQLQRDGTIEYGQLSIYMRQQLIEFVKRRDSKFIIEDIGELSTSGNLMLDRVKRVSKLGD